MTPRTLAKNIAKIACDHKALDISVLDLRKLTSFTDYFVSTAARLKLKGIDGEAHNQWSMWFNSIQSAEPYLDLTFRCTSRETGKAYEGAEQPLHGCRQLVS